MRHIFLKFKNLSMIVMMITVATTGAVPASVEASNEFVVYSVYQGLHMGNPEEVAHKDYYVNMGSRNGVREGTVLTVLRRTSSYDLGNKKLYKDVTFPIARIKVIHVEDDAAIARMERYESELDSPVFSPRAVMVGDLVRMAN